MDINLLQNKKVSVIGAARSGAAVAVLLKSQGANVLSAIRHLPISSNLLFLRSNQKKLSMKLALTAIAFMNVM